MNQSHLFNCKQPRIPHPQRPIPGKQTENEGKHLNIEAYQEKVQSTCILAAIFCFII